MSKDILLDRLQGQIDEWSAELESLQASASETPPEAQEELQRRIADLKEELALAMKKREELQRGGDPSWITGAENWGEDL